MSAIAPAGDVPLPADLPEADSVGVRSLLDAAAAEASIGREMTVHAGIAHERGCSAQRVPLALALALAASNAHCVQLRPLLEARFDGRNVSLRYEGTCAHLACCSSYAVAVAEQTVGAFHCSGQASAACRENTGWFSPAFTCDPHEPARYRQPADAPYLGCDDNERWLSLPGLTRAQCGERYLVCYRGLRVTAVARDRSAPNDSGRVHFEGSLGLLRALRADPDDRETEVSIYALDERDRIARDPHCVGSVP